VGYIDEGAYDQMTLQKSQYLKDPFSDTMVRMVDSAITRFRTSAGVLTVDDAMSRVTGLIFAFLAGTRPIYNVEAPLASLPRSYVPDRTVYRDCSDIYVSNTEISFTMDCPDFAMTEDNGNLEETVSADGTMGYNRMQGLWFLEAYEDPLVMSIIGPAMVSSTVTYDVRSTKSATVAATRLTTSRVRERVYRRAQDFLISSYVTVGDRQISRRFRYLAGWGLVHNQVQRYAHLEASARACSLWTIFPIFMAFLADVLREALAGNRAVLMRYHFDHHALRVEYADLPGPKRLLRLSAVARKEAQPLYYFGEKSQNPVACVKDETAKVGKRPRQFVSLGDDAVMDDPVLPALLKKAWGNELEFHFRMRVMNYGPGVLEPGPVALRIPFIDRGVSNDVGTYNAVFKFVGTSEMNALDLLFDGLFRMYDQHMYDTVFAISHSDDCGVGCWLRLQRSFGEAEWCYCIFDTDIAKCDLSHGPGLFTAFEKLMNSLDLSADILLRQLMRDLMIRHPDRRNEAFLILRHRYPLLFSGSVLTTIVNEFASYILSLAYAHEIANWRLTGRVLTLDEAVQGLIHAAADVGYEVTVEPTVIRANLLDHLSFPRWKFLMVFPVWCPEKRTYVGIPCLGRLFRNLGWTKEKPLCPTQMYKNIVQGFLSSHTSAWHELVSQLVLGVSHTSLPLIRDEYINGNYNHAQIDVRCEVNVNDISLRYGVTTEDLLSSTEFFFRSLQPRLVVDRVIARILEVDYGIT